LFMRFPSDDSDHEHAFSEISVSTFQSANV
jgi:hypothetical protein